MLIALHEKDVEINYDKLIIKALLHDLDETMTGDVLYPMKHEYGSGKIGQLIKDFVPELIEKDLLANIDNDEIESFLIAYWKIAKSGDIEGEIVCAADMIDCHLYALKEIKTGNKSMQGILTKSYNIMCEKYRKFVFVNLVLDETEIYTGRL